MLAFSHIGEDFKRRLRMFPALVNCCTIDWFSNWPEEALLSDLHASTLKETVVRRARAQLLPALPFQNMLDGVESISAMNNYVDASG